MNKNRKIIVGCLLLLVCLCGYLFVQGQRNQGKDTTDVVKNETISSERVAAIEQETVSGQNVDYEETRSTSTPGITPESTIKPSASSKPEGESKTQKKEPSDKKPDKKSDKKSSKTQTSEKKKTEDTEAQQGQHENSGVTGQNTTSPSITVPATPTPSKTPKCSLNINCSEVFSHMDQLSESGKKVIPASGIFFQGDFELQEGDTAFDVIKRACQAQGMLLDYVYTPIYSSYYIKGIGNLYEFDCGDESGWMYMVNGKEPGYGCNQYKVSEGDQIEFYYTCKR